MSNGSAAVSSPTAEQERNVGTCRRVLTEVWGNGKLEICDEVFTTDFVRHDANGPDSIGASGYKDLVRQLRAAFPDMRVDIENLSPSGNAVFFRTTMYATHTGEFYGLPATGAKIVVKTHAEVHFDASGMSVEAWVISDYLGLTKSILNAMSLWQKLCNLPALLKLMK